MKHLYILLAAIMLLTSCGDFFEESSQDEIRPTTVEDLASLLYSEAYPYSATTYVNDAYLTLLTDEVECWALTDETMITMLEKGSPVFCFSPTMFDGVESFISEENSWKSYYTLIKGCNVVLDYADDMKGSEKDRIEMKGQARALRAYYYQKLVSIYCQTYSAGNPDQYLGVPLITSSHVSDQYPTRATLRETCEFIESEYMKAAEELKDFVPTTKYRITKTAVNGLLSRHYLYTEEWEKLISVASMTINDGPSLTNFDQLRSSYMNIYDMTGSPEIVWNYGGRFFGSEFIEGTNLVSGRTHPYNVSAELKALFEVNDRRYDPTQYDYNYITSSSTLCQYGTKTSLNNRIDGEHGLRMAEVYLNRAEAYARTGDVARAMADLNTLRESRFRAGTYTPLTASSADDAVSQIIEERRRELLWEDGFRWIDIKRLGLSVTHIYIDANGTQTTYTLPANSPLYALPIPQDAISKNKNLVQNPR
ncbi:MAG: RagB/SusD family nutrient uptake outer membrane protein [Prevotella sp.]|nr:RagB/SusD family nutrient uptake outer membrane protein [Prevotella sp.]